MIKSLTTINIFYLWHNYLISEHILIFKMFTFYQSLKYIQTSQYPVYCTTEHYNMYEGTRDTKYCYKNCVGGVLRPFIIFRREGVGGSKQWTFLSDDSLEIKVARQFGTATFRELVLATVRDFGTDVSGLRYRQFGSSLPTVREFYFFRLIINKYDKNVYYQRFIVLLWFFWKEREDVPFGVHVWTPNWIIMGNGPRNCKNTILSCSFYNYWKSSISHNFIYINCKNNLCKSDN